jgi:sodium-dependent phosphate cotransporter
LTFLVTHSIYLPATVLGYAVLPVLDPTGLSGIIGLSASPLQLFEPATAAITAAVGPAVAFVLAVALLFGSLQLFDSVLEHVDTGTLRDRFFSHLRRTHISFLIGLLVTTATTSVAFSLGVIVPLYNRGYVERDELVPYVLGANLGTVFDTLVVAIVLESGAGVAVVLALLGSATLVTLLALVLHDQYTRGIATVDDLLLADRRLFVAFLASLLVVPLALVIGPLWLG